MLSILRSGQRNWEQVQSQLIAARQDAACLSAHVNVRRAFEVLNFAEKSAENIMAQAELEDALVERGAGHGRPQAKVTLAGAEARRVQSKGALEVALNSYRTLFDEFPKEAAALANNFAS